MFKSSSAVCQSADQCRLLARRTDCPLAQNCTEISKCPALYSCTKRRAYRVSQSCGQRRLTELAILSLVIFYTLTSGPESSVWGSTSLQQRGNEERERGHAPFPPVCREKPFLGTAEYGPTNGGRDYFAGDRKRMARVTAASIRGVKASCRVQSVRLL
jgi:hypothetical protein